MSGPTLQLNITAPGQQKVEQTVSSVERLAAALRDLPKASAELLKLQKALNSTQAPSGLKSGAGDLKELVGEIKNLGAQLNTSFGSLEETIKKGWGKAAKAQVEGEASLRSSPGATKGRTFTSTGSAGQPVEVPVAWFAKMQTGAEKIKTANLNAAHTEALSIEAAAARVEAATQRADARLQARFAKRYAREEQERINLQVNSSKMAEAARVAAEKESAGLAAAAAKLEAATQRADARLQARFAKRYAREEQERINLQVNSSKMAEAARVAAEKEAAAIQAAAAKVLQAQQVADAKYAAMSQRGQARAVLQARSRLDQGVAPDAVAGSFGSAALMAAQSTTLSSAMSKVHTQVDQGTPKFKTLGVAMSDAHSAARGLASGFGAMYLTWGHIAPLLAGAAISQSFVTSIKLGVEARQSLEVLKVLSQETDESVAVLEAQMTNLARTGPFGPTKVAEAMKILSLAGLEAVQVASAIKPALDLSIAGGVTIEKSAETLAAVGTAYGYTANQYSLVSDAITKAAAISMSSVDSMAESFRSSTMIAQAYGVSLKDSATGLALLANVGIRGSAAGVSLRQMYSELSGASRVTREAMKKLGVEVLDNEGKMKNLLTIAEELSKGLEKFSGKARVRAIQDISNERGGKGLVAVVSAVEAEVVKKMASVGVKSGAAFEQGLKEGMTDKFRLIRDQMDEMEGFAATSAARLASTPLTLLQGVKASFEQSLVDAFKVIEPTLIVLSVRLREVFNSPEFISGVTTLVKSVGSFTTVLFESVEALKALGIGFLVYKTAQVALLTVELMSAAMATTAVRTGLAAVGFTGMGAAAAAATPAVGGLAAATGVLAATLRLAGPLAVAITLAAVAWQTYAKHSEDSRKVAAEADRQRTNITLDALTAEAERLHTINQEVLKGADAHYAEAKAKEESAKQSRRLAFDSGREALVEEVEKARKKELIQGFDGRPLPENRGVAALAVTRLRTFEDKYSADEAAIRARSAWVRGESKLAEALRQKALDGAPKRPTGVAWDDKKFKADEEKNKADAAVKAAEDSFAAQIRVQQRTLDVRLKSADEAYNRERTLTEEAGRLQLIAESEKDAKLLELQGKHLDARTSASLKYLQAIQIPMAGLEGTALAEQFAESYQATFETGASAYRLEVAKAALKLQAGMSNPLSEDAPKELPAWKKTLAEWANAQKVLEDGRDNFMNGWVERGRSMWGEFLKTGKLSMKSLGDLVTETIADITYKQFIARPLSKLGEAIFDGGIKPVAGAQGGGSATGDLGQTFQNLRTAAGDLGLSFQNLGSSAWKMLTEFGQGLAAALQGAGGSGGGWGGMLAGLFGGGGKSAYVDNTGMDGGVGLLASAYGNAFNQGVLAFASGGIVDRPTYFKFGKGGSNLGLMGEAGAEAILPLARGADGNLGVRAQASAGTTNVTVASKTTVVIENHGGGPEPEVQTNTQPNGDEMIRVVIKAAAKDMTSGGPLRKAARSSNSLPRY